MNVSLHAELSTAGDRIVLVAGGPVADVAFTARRLSQLTPAFKPSDPRGALLCPLSWAAVVQLAAVHGQNWVPGPRLVDWTLAQATQRSAPLERALDVPIPDGFVPRAYQVAGAQMIAATGHTLITDEPGTGKSITTILGLGELARRNGGKTLPLLVICPASVVDPWVAHLRDWAPYWHTIAWRGSPEKRRQLIGTAQVYVASYDTARMDAQDTNPSRSPLVALNAAALVADECHYLKTARSQRSLAVRRLARTAKAFVALSGTPITHHPGDLWPTLACVAPGAYPSRERWVNRYCLSVPGDYGDTILGLNPGTEAEFRVSLLGQHRRVAKADVLDQLPPKVYSVRSVALPPAYRKAYDAMAADMLAELPDGQEMSVMEVLAQLTCLSALACAAADVQVSWATDDSGESKRHQHIELKNPSWKVDALLEILDERPGQAVVAFAPSAQLMRLAGAAAARAGYRVGYVIGGQSMRARTDTVAAFQGGGLDLICATTGAGGVGITLTAAATVVFLARPWSLVESIQAEDRAHRIGSERHASVEIIDIVATDTVDTRVRAVLRDKAGQLADLVQDARIVAELLGGASISQLRKKAS